MYGRLLCVRHVDHQDMSICDHRADTPVRLGLFQQRFHE